ncbi:hypothetical protein X777_06776 [Ooceraea biroi]|uniref:Uncharacterized protein n=1 Tax=Ooceraea biroi TaxID=2015173 RepID=A0A026WF84_OOCBI|nr:hypothetical protein X777_06776 [Ooceraea biroi]
MTSDERKNGGVRGENERGDTPTVLENTSQEVLLVSPRLEAMTAAAGELAWDNGTRLAPQQRQRAAQCNLFFFGAAQRTVVLVLSRARARANSGHRLFQIVLGSAIVLRVESKVPLMWLTSGCRLGIEEDRIDDDEGKKKRTMRKRRKTKKRLATKAMPTSLACGNLKPRPPIQVRERAIPKMGRERERERGGGGGVVKWK